MEVIPLSNVFSSEDINGIFSFIFTNTNQRFWSINKHFWEEGLQNLSPGTVSVFAIEGNAKTMIEYKLQQYLKPGEKITTVQYYEWNQLSQINWHNDNGKNAAITIYLNEEWNENLGGFFCWKDESNNRHLIIPEFNTGVLIRGNPQHHVSLINPFAPTRKTLQIWIMSSLDTIKE